MLKVPRVLDNVRRPPRYQQLARVAGHARRPHADFRRVAHFVHRHHKIHLVLHDARRQVRERHQTLRQQHHRLRILRVHHRIPQRPAARCPRRAVGIAELVARRHPEKRHVYLQFPALQQVHPPAVRVDVHRLRHQTVRYRVRQPAAHPRGVDTGDDAVADVLYQRRVAGHQRARRQRQVFKPHLRQRLHHPVYHLVPFAERVVERNRHPVLQPALAYRLFQAGTQLALVLRRQVVQPRRGAVRPRKRAQVVQSRILLLQCFYHVAHHSSPVCSAPYLRTPDARARSMTRRAWSIIGASIILPFSDITPSPARSPSCAASMTRWA